MYHRKHSPERAFRPQAGVPTPAKGSGYISPERATGRSATPSGLGGPTAIIRGLHPCLDDWCSPSSSYQAFGLKGGGLQLGNDKMIELQNLIFIK